MLRSCIHNSKKRRGQWLRWIDILSSWKLISGNRHQIPSVRLVSLSWQAQFFCSNIYVSTCTAGLHHHRMMDQSLVSCPMRRMTWTRPRSARRAIYAVKISQYALLFLFWNLDVCRHGLSHGRLLCGFGPDVREE